jgi:hypothetical protein
MRNEGRLTGKHAKAAIASEITKQRAIKITI